MRRFLPLFIVGFIVASLLIYFFGDSGLLSYGNLERYKGKLEANVASLSQRHEQLDGELASLQESPARNEVLARRIGLYRPGDEVIRFEGAGARSERYDVGELLRMRRGRGTTSAWLKAAGIAVAALVGFLMIFSQRQYRKKANANRR